MARTVEVRSSVPRSTSADGEVKANWDFSCAYEVTVPSGDRRSPEAWARDLWEGASAPLRIFMVAGWRFVLRLRLGPRDSPDHILGWRVIHRDEQKVLCRLDSPLLTAENTFQLVDGTLVWSTFVSYRRRGVRYIWIPAALIHRVLVRISLRRVASTH